jgi:hypothetical protein
MKNEPERVKALFDQLINEPLKDFPAKHALFDAPYQQGVYVIYGPRLEGLYVGRTLREGGFGIRGRQITHRRELVKTQRLQVPLPDRKKSTAARFAGILRNWLPLPEASRNSRQGVLAAAKRGCLCGDILP